MITENGWEDMTDIQALDILKSVTVTIGRANAKTLFDSTLLEALAHAMKALEEKVKYSTGLSVCDNCDERMRLEDIYCRCFDENSCPHKSSCKIKNYVDSIKEAKNAKENI